MDAKEIKAFCDAVAIVSSSEPREPNLWRSKCAEVRSMLPAVRAMAEQSVDAEVEHLQQWVADLQSNMFINCVYCGYRAGEQETVSAEDLKRHVEVCPKHPMSALKAENELLRSLVKAPVDAGWEKWIALHRYGDDAQFATAILVSDLEDRLASLPAPTPGMNVKKLQVLAQDWSTRIDMPDCASAIRHCLRVCISQIEELIAETEGRER